MSGITSNVGIFSGINSGQLIEQLLALDARPKSLALTRISQLQGLSAAYLDINSRLSGLKSAAAAFGSLRVFDAANAASSNNDVLTANALAGAPQGTYQFIVDRLVSSQQLLTAGFTDSTSTGVGLTSITVESAQGRLDRDTRLSVLNGGQGVNRGKIVVTDSTGASTTVDMSRVETVGDVLSLLNNQSAVHISAKAEGDRLVITDAAGGTGRLVIANAAGYTTATSLGVAGTADAVGSGGKVSGTQINRVGGATSLRTLNDGMGVDVSTAAGTSTPDFTISTRAGDTIHIDIGAIYNGQGVVTSPPVTDLAGVIDRINTQSAGKVTASINAAGTGLRLVDNTTGTETFQVAEMAGHTTAADLGILGSAGGATIDGRRLVASLNSVLTRNLNGGSGLSDGFFEIIARDGSAFSFVADASGSVEGFMRAVSTATGGKITLSLNASGTGLDLTDNTGGTGTLTVGGTAASELGLTASASTSSVVRGARAQLKYVGLSSRVADLNGGKGIGTGVFEITDTFGRTRRIDIGSDTATVNDLIAEINSNAQGYAARINNNGDGIIIEEVPGTQGAGNQKMKIRDVTGTVAKSLNLVGTAAGLGSQNKLDGSYERTVTVAAGDTLQTVADKINQAGVMVTAGVINDGSPARPFRLTLTARDTGEAGRFTIDTGTSDLGLTTLSTGTNSRVFFGAGDPASAILFSSSTNAVSGVLANTTLDLKSPSTGPVTLTISRNYAAVEDAVDDFVAAFNQVVTRIDAQTTYDSDTNRRGILLGDSVSSTLRGTLTALVQGTPLGVSGRYQSLPQVGITVGRNGQLQVDKARLRQAIDTDPQAVKDLFVAKVQENTGPQQVLGPNGQPIPGVTVSGGANTPPVYTSLGVLERVVVMADQYINTTSGVLTRQNRSLTDQMKSQNDRIASIDRALASKRTRLQRQFSQMEQTIGQLQSQQGSLGNIRNLLAS